MYITSANGRALIEQFEGLRLKAYKDIVGVWTIGYGHTSAAGAPTVTPGLTITSEQADAILARDLAATERKVNELVKVSLTQNEFDALVSLAYNIGVGNFAKSTLLRLLNQRNYGAAAQQFGRWTKARGKTLKALVTRRKKEATLFMKGMQYA